MTNTNKVNNLEKRYITDVIGDNFKNWGKERIVIDAGTCCGKTTFIINALLGWVEEKYRENPGGHKILYLCNRVSLRGEIIVKIEQSGEQCKEDGQEYEFQHIDVWSYQHLENICKRDKKKLDDIMNRYDYIVADEFHYFTSDACFNHNTDISYFYLEEMTKKKTVIYMSATGKVLIDGWEKCGKLHDVKRYTAKKDYDYISGITIYRTDAERREILSDLRDGEKALVFVRSIKELKNLREEYGGEASYYCSANNGTNGMDELQDCIQNGQMKKRILFTTTALYNGIDIKDTALRHIIVELINPVDIEQAIGRKRPISPADTCRIYLRERTDNFIDSELRRVQELLEPGEAWLDRKENNGKSWNDFFKKTNAAALIDKRVTLGFDHYECKYTLQKMAINELRYEKNELEKMKENGYIQTLKDELFDEMGTVYEYYILDDLKKYLEKNVNRPIKKEEMQENIIRLGQFEQKGNRPWGLKALNKKLEKYHYKIESVRKWDKKSENYAKTFWEIHDA